jgi:hypothetical protein
MWEHGRPPAIYPTPPGSRAMGDQGDAVSKEARGRASAGMNRKRRGGRHSGCKVSFGSKCEELNMSKSGPLHPAERTSTRRAATSLKGQERNCRSHSMTSSAPPTCGGCTVRISALALLEIDDRLNSGRLVDWQVNVLVSSPGHLRELRPTDGANLPMGRARRAIPSCCGARYWNSAVKCKKQSHGGIA